MFIKCSSQCLQINALAYFKLCATSEYFNANLFDLEKFHYQICTYVFIDPQLYKYFLTSL
jgi:hypothetical protein